MPHTLLLVLHMFSGCEVNAGLLARDGEVGYNLISTQFTSNVQEKYPVH